MLTDDPELESSDLATVRFRARRDQLIGEEGMTRCLAHACAEAEVSFAESHGKVPPVAFVEYGDGRMPRCFDVPEHVQGQAILSGLHTMLIDPEVDASMVRFGFVSGTRTRNDLVIILMDRSGCSVATAASKTRTPTTLARYDVQYTSRPPTEENP